MSVGRAAFLGFTAILGKGPKPNDRSTVIVAAIYTCQIGADFGFEVVCGILYKLGELDGETERIVTSPNHFGENGTSASIMPLIPVLKRSESRAMFFRT